MTCKDTLFLIAPGFKDTSYEGTEPLAENQIYYCPFCASLEGVLAVFPRLNRRLEVVRVPFARPRLPVIKMLGEENQSLPKLVLGDATDELANGRHGHTRFVAGHEAIMSVLSKRHGLPYPHF